MTFWAQFLPTGMHEEPIILTYSIDPGNVSYRVAEQLLINVDVVHRHNLLDIYLSGLNMLDDIYPVLFIKNSYLFIKRYRQS